MGEFYAFHRCLVDTMEPSDPASTFSQGAGDAATVPEEQKRRRKGRSKRSVSQPPRSPAVPRHEAPVSRGDLDEPTSLLLLGDATTYSSTNAAPSTAGNAGRKRWRAAQDVEGRVRKKRDKRARSVIEGSVRAP